VGLGLLLGGACSGCLRLDLRGERLRDACRLSAVLLFPLPLSRLPLSPLLVPPAASLVAAAPALSLLLLRRLPLCLPRLLVRERWRLRLLPLTVAASPLQHDEEASESKAASTGEIGT
jgi:hypothetical protein